LTLFESRAALAHNKRPPEIAEELSGIQQLARKEGFVDWNVK
jgi:hypothetical protein